MYIFIHKKIWIKHPLYWLTQKQCETLADSEEVTGFFADDRFFYEQSWSGQNWVTIITACGNICKMDRSTILPVVFGQIYTTKDTLKMKTNYMNVCQPFQKNHLNFYMLINQFSVAFSKTRIFKQLCGVVIIIHTYPYSEENKKWSIYSKDSLKLLNQCHKCIC